MAAWELFLGWASVVVAVTTWALWYGDVFRVNRFAGSRLSRWILGLTPCVCLLLLLVFLERAAAKAVRENGFYILFYLALGAAALGISSQLFSFLGISARDDALERRNRAGLIAVVGALLGIILCFSGGNIGEGPGVEVVIVSASAAMSTWFVLWYLLEVLSGHRVSERITVDRDTSSAVRLAGLLVAKWSNSRRRGIW